MTELRVLLCDDDPDLLGLLTRRLEKMGLEYDVANDGREAKSLIEKNEYDAIVADIYMPEATGLEVMQFAKQRDPDIQVVIITSSATLDNAIDALNHGAFGYLTKPFDHLIVFDNMVSRAVEYRHLLGANQHKAEAQKRRGDMLEDEVAERIAQLHKKQKGLLDLLATLPDGILVVEEGGKVVLSSPVGERWLARDRKSEHQPIHAFIAQVNSQVAERSAKARVEDHDLQLIAVDFPADGDMRRKAVIIREIEADGIGAGSLVTETVIGIKKGLATLYQEGIGTKVVLNLANQFAVLEQLAGWSPAERGIATGSVLQSQPVTHTADEPIEPGVRSAPASIADSSPTTQGAVDPINNEGSDALKPVEEPQGPKLNTAELAEALRAAAQTTESVRAEPAVQMESAPEPMPKVQTEPAPEAVPLAEAGFTEPKPPAVPPSSVEPRPESEPATQAEPTTVPEPTFPKTQPSV
ncbi:MAG: response regulator, partial [Chloroflexota bacterium]